MALPIINKRDNNLFLAKQVPTVYLEQQQQQQYVNTDVVSDIIEKSFSKSRRFFLVRVFFF